MPGKSCFCRKWTKPVLLLRPARLEVWVCVSAVQCCLPLLPSLPTVLWCLISCGSWASGLALLGSIFSAGAEIRRKRQSWEPSMYWTLLSVVCDFGSRCFLLCRIRCQWSRKWRKGKYGPTLNPPFPALSQATSFLTLLVSLMYSALKYSCLLPTLPTGLNPLLTNSSSSLWPLPRYDNTWVWHSGPLQAGPSPQCRYQPALLSLVPCHLLLMLCGFPFLA